MTQPTDTLEDLVSPVAAWVGMEEARGSLNSRFPTARKFWRRFPNRLAPAFLKSPKNCLLKRSTDRFKRNCGVNTTWAIRQTKQRPKSDITSSIWQPSRKTFTCRPGTGITSNGRGSNSALTGRRDYTSHYNELMFDRNSPLDLTLLSLSISSSMASTGESGFSTLRNTHIRCRSSLGIRISSFLVPER